jgi:D-alanyl-D-alanine dipeptidase
MASSLSLLHPEVHRRVLRLLRDARARGVGIRITSTYRTRAEQVRLYEAWLQRGRTGLPAAPPGTSTHEYGVAVDLVVSPVDRLAEVVELAGCAGLMWAGTGDPVHFDVYGIDAWRTWVARNDFPPQRGYHC